MRKFKHNYTIFRDNSPKMFKYACMMIENSIPKLAKRELIIDIDNTIQEYELQGREIVVFDDYDVGAVYVVSDLNLDSLFEIKSVNE